MVLVSIWNKIIEIFGQLGLYCLLAVVVFVPYSYELISNPNLTEGFNECRNINLLCAPIFQNNLMVILQFLNSDAGLKFFNYICLFILFIVFWLRIIKFEKRGNFLKFIGIAALLTSPAALFLLAYPDLGVLTTTLFILISIGFEVINHGLIIRGLLICSSLLPLLLLNGVFGFLLGLITPSFLYFMVKWHILKKYTSVSYVLLLFPAVAILLGIFYLNYVYDGNMADSLVNTNIKSINIEQLLNWWIFIPLFFIYYFKDKKGLNQIKRFIIPIFFFVNCAIVFLELAHSQQELFGMCILCLSFEMISDTKFNQRSLSLVILFVLFSWIVKYSSLLISFWA